MSCRVLIKYAVLHRGHLLQGLTTKGQVPDSQRGFLLGVDILTFSKSNTSKHHHRDIFRQKLPDRCIASIIIVNTFLFPQVSWWPWDKEASTWTQCAFAMDRFICPESLILEQEWYSEWRVLKSYSPQAGLGQGCLLPEQLTTTWQLRD